MIKTLRELYKELDQLFLGISKFCWQCKDYDCQGYVWLLPQEAERLYKLGIEVLEVNNSVSFIHCFSDKGGKINVELYKPQCPYYKGRKCTIYKSRPLACRMYPLNFASEDGIIYLVLHLDCLFSRQKGNISFQKQAISLFKKVDLELLKKMVENYKLVYDLSKFPRQKNRYLPLIKTDQFFCQ